MSPCKNNGKCVLDTTVACGFRCECGISSTGYFCETTNFCAVNPCKNGGTCENLRLGHHCTCSSKFYGTECERGFILILFNIEENNSFFNSRTCTNSFTSNFVGYFGLLCLEAMLVWRHLCELVIRRPMLVYTKPYWKILRKK